MALLLPEADGIADVVARRLPQAEILRHGHAARDRLGEVTFYCLPYMGDADSIALIREMPRLEVVQSLSSGVDDVLGALPRNVSLSNGHGLGHEEGTAELAVTLMLACLRQIPWLAGQQSRRTWSHVRTESLDGKRVLLVGYGTIGVSIEHRLMPFGAQIGRVSRTAREGVAALPELPRLASWADVLVICIGLHAATRGLVNSEVLSALHDGALLVNVARGAVVDAEALTGELRTGRLRAALDVTDIEPLPADRPEWTLPNVLITPHIGGDTATFAARAPDFVAAQVARYLAGHPLQNMVRPARA